MTGEVRYRRWVPARAIHSWTAMGATMRTTIAVVAMVLGMHAAAEEPLALPKEGSSAGTAMGSGTLKVLPMGAAVQIAWEWLGAHQSEDPRALLHGASVRCVGSVLAVNGEYRTYTNSCVFTRPDGDQVFVAEAAASGRMGGSSQGTGTILGGTGKVAGITGTTEFTRMVIRPAMEGTFQTITRSKASYKLP